MISKAERVTIVKKLFITYDGVTSVYVYRMFRNVICNENSRNITFLYIAEEGDIRPNCFDELTNEQIHLNKND